MSSLIVPVAKVENVRVHPNADALELANVLGWQMAVPKGMYKDGDKVVYFPIDVCIPAKWSDKWNITKYLKAEGRVGKIQLRGEPSFGLAQRIPEGCDNWELGENVASYFECKKYEAPIRASCGDAAAPNSLFIRYTDIENMRNFPTLLSEGEEIIATEKNHGMNCRLSIIDNLELAGSREVNRKKPEWMKSLEAEDVRVATEEFDCKRESFITDREDFINRNKYSNSTWFPWTLPSVKNMLYAIKNEGAKQVILFGEVYGGSIQSLDYGIPKGKGLGFVAFDLLIDGKWQDYDVFKALCDKYGVPTVPLIYRGPFSFDVVRGHSEGNTMIGDVTHIREGVVVKPIKERHDPKMGRVILKYVSDTYLFSKNSDFKDF